MRLPPARLTRLFAVGWLVLASAPALASGDAHTDPVAPLLLMLAVVLLAAKVFGDIAVRLRQPAVLGELLAGVVLGNLHLAGFERFDPIGTDPTIDLLARIGVIILLFEVGLESTVGGMMKVGARAFAVAVVGVVVPALLGFLVGTLLMPDESIYAHVFVGATLCATSVGITARVLKDLNAHNSTEAKVILGAAVIDDVLGLVVLAVVAGIIGAVDTGGTLALGDVALIIVKAGGFLAISLVLGVMFSRRLFDFASRLRARGVLLATGLSFCFVLAWAANAIGLAPIVGAFAAGLILEDVHYREFKSQGEHGLEELVAPISSMLVPVFFVLMGMRTDLRAFADPAILGVAAGLTVAAVAGKQVCGLVAGSGMDRLTVGIGMVPRGEVGLIFANMGLSLSIGGVAVVNQRVYAALVVMVIVTTMLTPPALGWSLRRHARTARAEPAPPAPGV